MQNEFWHEKWRTKDLGFHQAATHPLLKKYWPQLAPARHSRVLVPLCGKSSDLLWLERCGHRVLGVELSPIAARAFFAENDLSAKQSEQMAYKRYCAGNIELLCGDFFALTRDLVGEVHAVFDRAALVALPEMMRLDYVKKIRALTGPGVQVLLVIADFDSNEISPPPFAVPEAEVRRLYQGWCEIKVLGEIEAQLRDKTVLEVAYQLLVR